MYCRYCGTELETTARFCHNCGMPVGGPEPPEARTYYSERSGLAAVLMSAVVVGLGQIYAGKAGRGVKLLVLMVLLLILSSLLVQISSWLWPFSFSLPALWLYGMHDAYSLCREYNRSIRELGYPPW